MDQRITKHPHPLLKTQCIHVSPEDIEELSDRLMAVFMDKKIKAVGLAANQIGMNASAFVYDAGKGPRAIFNPIVVWRSMEDQLEPEGCLSLPGLEFPVRRPDEIRMQCMDHKGKVGIKKFTGWEARVVSHEIDHLYGRTILDRKK